MFEELLINLHFLSHVNTRGAKNPLKNARRQASLYQQPPVSHVLPPNHSFYNLLEVGTECVVSNDLAPQSKSRRQFLAVLDSLYERKRSFSSQGIFGPIFLGDVSPHLESPDRPAAGSRRFVGCIGKLWVNSNDSDLMGDAVRGRNIKNCDPPVCQHLPCRNGGTCIRYKVTFHMRYHWITANNRLYCHTIFYRL